MGIDVVDLVKPPEKGYSVIEAVPPVIEHVEEDEREEYVGYAG